MKSTAGKITVGITGLGGFGTKFIPLFRAHPLVAEVCVADTVADRVAAAAAEFGIKRTFPSHGAMCGSDVDAIAIFSQRHLHAPQALSALDSGKAVYSAVPAGVSVEEVTALVEKVAATGLVYMMGETSYYYPAAVYCRRKFREGGFGKFVYGEGEYMHDMSHGFYEAYRNSGGGAWKRVAGIPPMFYPTHSVSMIASVTGARMVDVSCLGFVDGHEDGIFGAGRNMWDNPFSNQSALFRTSDGGMCRINEFRRVGHGVGSSVRTSLYGTEGCYEEQGNARLWTDLARNAESVAAALECDEHAPGVLQGSEQADFFSGTAAVHDIARLPGEFRGLPNGHFGSHQFLVDDFVRAVTRGALPPNHVWAAARYTIPGLVAHESSLREGERLPVPDTGDRPPQWPLIDTYDAPF